MGHAGRAGQRGRRRVLPVGAGKFPVEQGQPVRVARALGRLNLPLKLFLPFLLEGPQVLLPNRAAGVHFRQSPQDVDAGGQRRMGHRQQAVTLQQGGQRLLQAVSLVQFGRHFQQQGGGRRDATALRRFDPLHPFGKVQERDYVQQVRLDVAQLDGFAAQSLPQQRSALVQAFVDFLAGDRVVGRRRPQKIHPIIGMGIERTANIIDNALIVEHGNYFVRVDGSVPEASKRLRDLYSFGFSLGSLLSKLTWCPFTSTYTR